MSASEVNFGLLGNPFAQRVFANIVKSGNFAPAYLLEGPEGVGKATLALRVAAATLCESPEVKPCGQCPACKRVLTLQHPDVKVILPKDAPVPRKRVRPPDFSRTTKIGIDKVRQIAAEVAKPPSEARRRFVLVLDGDLMTPEAQNAFLKVLEEPGERTTFFVITPYPEGVLPTIRSRSRRIRFYSLSLQDFSKFPFGSGVSLPLLHRLSGGSVGLALRLLDKPVLHVRDHLIEALRGSPQELAEAVAECSGRDMALVFVKVAYSLVADLHALKAGAPEVIVNVDRAEELKELAEALSWETLKRLMADIRFAEEAVARYLPPAHVLPQVFLSAIPKTFKDTVWP